MLGEKAMADEIVTRQQLVDAGLDAESLQKFISGLDSEDVLTRLGKIYPTLAKLVRMLMETGGWKAYSTEAELLATVPTVNPSVGYAFDTKKLYKWNGTAWIDEGLSQLDQANNYTDKAVSDVIKKGVNLFNKNSVTLGKYYNYSNGELWDAPATLFAASEFILVEPNTEYQVPTFYDQQFAFFDENKGYVSGQVNASPTFKFTTPSNAKYIGLTVRVPQFDTFMFCKSSEFPPTYEPYRLSIDSLAIESSNVLGLKNSVEKVVGIYEANIIDLSKVTVGKYVPYSNGELWDNSASTVMGYYEVEASTKYKTSSFYNQQFAFYDAEKKYISGLISPDSNHEFITPSNAKYVRFTVPNDQVNDLVIAESSVFSDGYKPHSVNINNLKVSTNQVLDFENQVREIAHLENVNIFNPFIAINGKYYNYQNGELWDAAWASAGLYEVEPNTAYKTSTFYDQQFAFFDSSKVYISGQINALPDNVFTTPINAAYIGLTVPNAQINTLVVAKQSIFPTVYVPFGVSAFSGVMLPDNTLKTTKTSVSATANGANAIQNKIDSIADATDKNRYQIDVDAGVYKVEQANQFLGYPTYPAMICPKSHIDIVGKGLDKTIVWAELPYIDANISNASNGEVYPRERYQTIYNYADDVTIQGITFVGQNLRYTMHQDDSRGVDTKRHYVDCGFVFKGDKGWKQTLGIGTHSGEETYVKGGYSQSDGLFAFACHNNVDFKHPSVWSFENHTFSSLGDAQAISMQSCGSLVSDKLELIGCGFGGRSYILTYGDSSWMTATENRDYFNHAEWQITGYNNEPFLFNNVVEDSCLRFKTTATGVSTSIRFDKNSSAYPLLIKNNRLNTDKSVYTGRDYIDGYIVQDGSVDMSAQAWGCRDVSERVYIYDGSSNFTSLGKRLGDCSTTNKTLGVIVNGTSNTITFNKDYSTMTNAQIITEMSGQLSGVTVSLYSYGRDYYPQLSDATEVVYNTGSTFIPKGSIVAKSKGDIHLAGENDKVYGVALDDIPVVKLDSNGAKKGQGRLLKLGYISTDRSKAHFVLADNQSPSVGTRFKVVNGQLITDVNGKISVDIDDGVISINC